MFENEVNQGLALKPAGPHVVALALDDFKSHWAAELIVAGLDDRGVFIQRHHAIHVAVDMKDRHLRLGQGREAVDGVVLR